MVDNSGRIGVEIQKLIKDCYDGKYKGILIVEVTRLSRGNQGDAQKIMDCLKYSNMNNGLLVITPTKTYDVAHNTDDEEYMEFELFMSRREHKMIGKRMLRGRHQSVVEGNYISSYRPYGYNIIKTRTSRTLIPNKDEAPIVKMIFDMAVNQNMSSGKIARYLTISGIPTYYGEREWNPDTIKAILTNETYTGKVRWNYTMKIKTMVDGNLVSKRTNARTKSNITTEYRGCKLYGSDEGWTIDIPGDNNIYSPKTSALNAIDKALVGKPRKSHAKRFEKGINIIGKKNKDIG